MGGVYGREPAGGGGGEKVTYHSPKLTTVYELRGMSAENLADEVRGITRFRRSRSAAARHFRRRVETDGFRGRSSKRSA